MKPPTSYACLDPAGPDPAGHRSLECSKEDRDIRLCMCLGREMRSTVIRKERSNKILAVCNEQWRCLSNLLIFVNRLLNHVRCLLYSISGISQRSSNSGTWNVSLSAQFRCRAPVASQVACRFGHPEIVKLLLEAGINLVEMPSAVVIPEGS